MDIVFIFLLKNVKAVSRIHQSQECHKALENERK